MPNLLSKEAAKRHIAAYGRPFALLSACFILSASAFAQDATIDGVPSVGETAIANAQQTVSGLVVDSQGEPLIGATVAVKGTSTATATDIDGNIFRLNGLSEEKAI